jgi:hypothetical protein
MAKYVIGLHRLKVSEIEHKIQFQNIEKAILRDKNLLCTVFSYATVFDLLDLYKHNRYPFSGDGHSSIFRFFSDKCNFFGKCLFRRKKPLLAVYARQSFVNCFSGLGQLGGSDNL